MAILKPKDHTKTRTMSFRLPADLLSEVDAIKAQAGAVGLAFDVSDVVHKALTSAVRQARQELGNTVSGQVENSPAPQPSALP
ncbi:hypothetical protein AB6Q56_08400 [Dechloromonas sp. ARDL1]|uniref:hypothetical protein n=1 Tax=Dechloromonas sp. ARDL1 TaxID=3322121 RepID=UPI003DA71A59